jgi:hypothetical protein
LGDWPIGTAKHFALVLGRDLEPNLALGYIEVARNWQLSCQDWSVLVEWTGDGAPPQPEVSL